MTTTLFNRAAAALLVLCLGAGSALAETLEFEGRVEAVHHAELASHLNGIITEIAFEGGEEVQAGDPLITLDPAEFELAVTQAEALLASARAQLNLAEQEAGRVRDLSSRGVATEARRDAAEATLSVARAETKMAEAELERARLDLTRTVIGAPISGFVSRPMAAVGTFVEAEAGPPLATIVQLDPALVAYRVPYAVRLETMEKSAASSLEELFGRITLRLVLPNGQAYPLTSQPRFTDATIDPESGALTIWARFDNPNLILRPGMKLTVLSDIALPNQEEVPVQ